MFIVEYIFAIDICIWVELFNMYRCTFATLCVSSTMQGKQKFDERYLKGSVLQVAEIDYLDRML